jgi:hypothetical protein
MKMSVVFMLWGANLAQIIGYGAAEGAITHLPYHGRLTLLRNEVRNLMSTPRCWPTALVHNTPPRTCGTI